MVAYNPVVVYRLHMLTEGPSVAYRSQMVAYNLVASYVDIGLTVAYIHLI